MARRDAGGEDHFVVAARGEQRGIDAGGEPHIDPMPFQLALKIADRLAELLLAGHPHREIELSADGCARIEQRDEMAA
jgi:hypothetical protein